MWNFIKLNFTELGLAQLVIKRDGLVLACFVLHRLKFEP
jgi:hypothetical protein